MDSNSILKIKVRPESKINILEKINKSLLDSRQFFHIVSLNPEILVSSTESDEFRKTLSESNIQICDGIGIHIAGAILNVNVGERINGVDLMEFLLQNLDGRSLHVLLLGAKIKLAEKLAECYAQAYKNTTFKGIQGFEDIRRPKKEEEKEVFRIISEFKPDIIFSAFGSPEQELWFDRHKEQLKGVICMGVGGGFDFAAGEIPRAPVWMRQIGFEWLFRLIVEPWRWRRQLNLLKFIYLLFLQKFGMYA